MLSNSLVKKLLFFQNCLFYSLATNFTIQNNEVELQTYGYNFTGKRSKYVIV